MPLVGIQGLLSNRRQLQSKMIGFSATLRRRDPYVFAAIGAIGLVLAAVQWAGGAWKAEFDGYPDEAGQFVSGRMIWEYIRSRPHEKPIEWAGQYYLHYPKIGIGHWPPAYPAIEAVWSLAFHSSRASAMGLQWFFGLAALSGLYVLARPRFPAAVTLGILVVAIATPVFQNGLEQTMAELACLLWSVVFIIAMLRLLDNPSRNAVYLLILALLAAGLTKGTAVCLVPVPPLALLASRRRLPAQAWWPIAVGGGLLGACALWYAFSINIVHWGGLTSSMPWPIPNLGRLAGWGFVGLALLGLRRDHLSIVAGSMLVSAAVTSFFVRAMNEPRHWIIILPAILILAANSVTQLPWRYLAVPLLLALALFPYSWYRQPRTGYMDLVRQLHLPARMLVSSGRSSWEGGWIAEVSLAEHYPGSFVVRGTKVFADSDWNGVHYRLITTTPAGVVERLDELAIDTIIVDLHNATRAPDYTLLLSAIAGNPTWNPCGSAKEMAAYCRTRPPVAPRKPLIVEAGGWRFVEKLGVSH